MSPENRGTEPPRSPTPDLDRLGSPVLTREVPAEPSQIARIRRDVLAFAARNANAELRTDIAIAVSEACANVVMHAYRDDPRPGTLTVEAFYDNSHLVVIVIDEGSGIAPRSDSPGIGLGLSLMRRLAQHVDITDHSPAGTRVLMRFATAN